MESVSGKKYLFGRLKDKQRDHKTKSLRHHTQHVEDIWKSMWLELTDQRGISPDEVAWVGDPEQKGDCI